VRLQQHWVAQSPIITLDARKSYIFRGTRLKSKSRRDLIKLPLLSAIICDSIIDENQEVAALATFSSQLSTKRLEEDRDDAAGSPFGKEAQ
jgi:hypothetical protein